MDTDDDLHGVRCDFEVRFDNPILRDHRVHGVRTMPGVTFLDVIYRVLRARGVALNRVELRSVLFVEPVVASEAFDREVQIELTRQGDGYQVRARSRRVKDGQPLGTRWTRHLEAELHAAPDAPTPSLDPAAMKRACVRRDDVEEVYRRGRAAEIEHHAFMKCEGALYHGDGGLLAELTLAPPARDYADECCLHPALLDASTMQSYALCFDGSEREPRPLIPMHIDAFQAVGPLGAGCLASVRVVGGRESGDVVYVDIDLHDPDGRWRARFSRLALKRVRSRELFTRLTAPEEAETHESAPAVGAWREPAKRSASGASHAPADLEPTVIAAIRECLPDLSYPVDVTRGFYDLGLESTHLLQVVRTLEQKCGLPLYPTLLFEYNTVASLARHLAEKGVSVAAAPVAEPATRAPARTLLFSGLWEADPGGGAAGESRPPGNVLIVDAEGDIYDELCRRAGGDGERFIRASVGGEFARFDRRHYRVARGDAAEFRRLLSALAQDGLSPDHVVHLLGQREDEGGSAGLLSAAEEIHREVFHFAQALIDAPDRHAVDVLYVTLSRSVVSAAAGVTGFAKTLSLEHPRLGARVVELERGPDARDVAAAVWRELGDEGERCVRYREGRRLRRRYVELALHGEAVRSVPPRVEGGEPPPAPLREGGVYVISGGGGGIGRRLASWLGRATRGRIVLFGRSKIPLADAESRLPGGGEVHAWQADVTRSDDVQRVVAEARVRFGRIDGVIHAAGVLADSFVREKSLADVRRVALPKIAGVVHLDAATRDEALDFFVVFSSLTAVVGNVGQADYALANAFTNAYVDERERLRAQGRRRGRSVAMCWPMWRDGGMQVERSTQDYFARQGQAPLPDEEALAALVAALRQDAAEIVVLHGDAERLRHSLEHDAALRLPLARPSAPAFEPGERREHANSGGARTSLATRDDIAIVGLAGRYPMAADVREFWANLRAGRDCITEIPSERWALEGFFDPKKGTPLRSYGRWGGFIADADRFDPAFFNLTPREAEAMDPQERLFLETVWHTLEDAGCPRSELASRSVGVFVGVMFNQYQLYGLDVSTTEPVLLPHSFSSSVANRVSYFFDFRGPSIALDTMCSSSLTAIHQACESLRRGECDVALAGGVNLSVHPYKYLYLSQAAFLSSEGRCRAFGQGGDGYVPGEGVGAVLLKPLAQARRDGDRVYAVVKGGAVNHGGRASGYTTPNPTAQAELIRRALELSSVTPDSIDYLEAHGTGTSLGDPIEMAGLAKVFGTLEARREACPIGSVKASIGHLEAAAGIAGVTKVLLQMQHRELAPSLHAAPPNPAIAWERAAFRVQRELRPWPEPEGAAREPRPRRAGVSAFGAGGANAHIILEECLSAEPAPAASATAPFLVLLSAQKEENLRALAGRYLDLLVSSSPPASAARVGDGARLGDDLRGLAAEMFGIDAAALDPALTLEEWGLDALDASRLAGEFGRRYDPDGVTLHPQPGRPVDEWVEALRVRARVQAGSSAAGDGHGLGLASLAASTQFGREPLSERLALVVADAAELRASLQDWLQTGRADGRVRRGSARGPGGEGRAQQDDVAREVELALQRRDLPALAALWVAGAQPDWRALHGGVRPRRVPLPLYPFTRRRCWIKAERPAALERGSAGQPPEAVAVAAADATDWVEDTLFAPEWVPSPLDAPADVRLHAPDAPASVVIVHTAAGRPLADALVARHAGADVHSIVLGDATADDRAVGRSAAATWQAVAGELRRPALIYFLGGLLESGELAGLDAAAALAKQEDTGVVSLFRCARALLERAAEGEVVVKLVTNGAWPVAGSDVTNPYAAALWGLARVMESENPRWTVAAVDVDLAHDFGARSDLVWDTLADTIVAEPAVRRGRSAYRGGLRYRQTLRPLTLPPARPQGIRPGAVVLIVGGAGGVGLETASSLLREHGARVALVGRSALSAARRERLEQLDPSGERLAYFQGDAREPASLSRVLAEVRGRFGALHGVIHSALVQHDRSLRNLDEVALRESLDAKCRAAAVMCDVLGGEPLDFMLFFSSVQSFLGDAGLANYAAGCAFQDAYACHLERRLAFPVRAYDWGYWGSTGAVAGEYYRERLSRQGFGRIAPEAGHDALVRGLESPRTQIAPVVARRALLERMGVEFDERLVGLAAASSPAPTDVAPRLAPPAAALRAVDEFHAVDQEMAEIAAGWLLQVLLDMGAFADSGERVGRDELARRLGVVPLYERLFDELLRLLCRRGLLSERAGHFSADATRALPDGAGAMQALAARHPDLAVFMDLLCLCLPRYAELLRGQVLATDLFFPRSQTSRMEGLYKGNTISDVYNDSVAACLLGYVEARRPDLRVGEKIRVLEVGAGTGGTTAAVLRALQPHAEWLEYCYTDLSVTFLEHGKQHYGTRHPFTVFRRLDADVDFEQQGLEPGGFDVVMASNCLHASRDIRRTLVHIKAALRPGGWVVLNELTSVTVQATLTYGLFEGWWCYDDSERRLPGSPLLGVAGWKQLLEELGYHRFVALPGEPHTRRNYQHVMCAASDGIFVRRTGAGKPQPEPLRAVSAPPAPAAAEPASERALQVPLAPGAATGEAARREVLARFEQDLLSLASSTSGIARDELAPDQELGEFGFDSISFGLLSDRLNERYHLDLTPATFYETPTLRALVEKLGRQSWSALAGHYLPQAAAPVRDEPAAPPPRAIAQPGRAPRRDAEREPIAIIGVAGRMPGSADLQEFWRHLIAGDDLVREVPADRWDWRTAYGGAEDVHGRYGGFIDDVDRFDPLFFGISPREAAGMDPQQRLFLEAAWACLEDAGIAPGSLSGSDTGIFVGVGSSDYEELQRAAGAEVDAFGATANTHSILVNRISFLLNVHGPSEPVNTGCSSSLVALHRAVEAIEKGDCELALAGGINLILSPTNYVLLSKTGMLSPDGRCKTFDQDANGFVRGEGLGVVLLTKLSRARAAGHTVRALVRGSAVNHGGRARSLTAPNPTAQARMLVRAYEQAGIEPDTVNYIETHGTGTALGDPVEINGLKLAFDELFGARGRPRPAEPYCALGAVKSSIGHLEAAAGIAGLLKVLLSMQHRRLAPCLHFRRLNPYIRLEGSGFYVAAQAADWPRVRDEQGALLPRRAGVSSFGYGGVNAHVVLEEDGPDTAAQVVADGPRVFVLSARTPAALREYAARFARFLRGDGVGVGWVDLTYTLALGRDALEQRLAVIASSAAELLEILAPYAEEGRQVSGLKLGAADGAARYGALVEGDEGAAFLRVVVEQRKLDKLAALWVNGVDIDWDLLYGAVPARRVPLPTYPFERTRCWIQAAAPASTLRPAFVPPPVAVMSSAAVADDALGHLLYTPRWVPLCVPATTGREPDVASLAARLADVPAGSADGRGAPALSDQEHARLEEIAVHWLAQTFRTEGLFVDETRTWTAAEIAAQVHALPKHQRLVAELLRVLTAGGCLARGTDDTLTSSGPPAVADPSAEMQRLCAQLPALAGFEKLLRRCLPNLFPVLRGERSATDVLFPASSMEYVQAIYTANPIVDPANRLIAGVIARAVEERLARAVAPVRLIEVGAGVGGATAGILERLKPSADRLRYTYTDVSNAFLQHGREHYAPSHPYLDFAVLDLERDTLEQGFEREAYDVVIASNVLHATRDLRASLAHVRALLRPGGWLVLNEATTSLATITVSFGLLDGWWLHAGEDFRLPGSPLLPFEGWQRVLGEAGFPQVVALPDATRRQPTQQIIVAELPGQAQAGARRATNVAVPARPVTSALVVHTSAATPLADALAATLRAADCARVELGVRTRPAGPGRFELDAADPQGWKALLPSLGEPDAVFFLGGVGGPDAFDDDVALALARGEEHGVVALFRLVKQLGERPAGRRALSLGVLSDNACAVHGEPLRHPFTAHLRGFARSLRREFPHWRVRWLDFDWDEAAASFERAASDLLRLVEGEAEELAWRGGRAYRQVLASAPLDARPASLVRAGGVYLILGGAGTIGLEVAADLVQRHAARVVLVGRSALDAARRQRIAAIDPRGENVLNVAADATDADALAHAAATARSKWGRLDGVVHAAFTLRDRSLHTMDEAWLRDGLSSTRICAALERVFAREALDFVLIFSSVQSFLGNPGQSSYAATCTFKDAFAERLRGRVGYPVRVINWGAWGEEGPAAQYRTHLDRAGARPLAVARGLEVVQRALQNDLAQVVAVDGTPEFLASLGVENEMRARHAESPAPCISVVAHSAVATPPAHPLVGPDATAPLQRRLERDVRRLVAESAQVPVQELDLDVELSRYGFDSISYTLLSNRFNREYELSLTPAYLYGISTTRDLVGKFLETHAEAFEAWYRDHVPAATPPSPAPATAPVRDVAGAAAQPPAAPRVSAPVVRAESTAASPSLREPVAVVGMAGRLPQSDDLDEFWYHLVQGHDLISEIPADRWDWRTLVDDPRRGDLGASLKWGGFVRHVDAFDAAFFGISAREADAMDPQQRLFLEAAWSCIESAGIRPSSLAGSNTGVFVGVGSFDYSDIQQRSAVDPDGYNTIGRAHCILANRVSYLLDLHGPSEAVDTACSSSLVALHRAVEAVQLGTCDAALAGGVNAILSPTLHIDLGRAGMLSRDGRCRTFDRGANGFVRAEGVGAVLLKPLSLALRHGDPIHAVIRATAVNHGGRTNALTAPNPRAQAALLVEAYRRAGVDPRTVSYIETHGTGTEIGDPIEIDALKAAFAQLYRDWQADAPTAPHCALGALKSNVGHLECASGIAGLLKALLCLRHETLPANLHLRELNPYIQLEGTPFHVLRGQQPWARPRDTQGAPVALRAGVSAFGVGGVNAHVVLEEYASAPPLGGGETGPQIVVLSARSRDALRDYARALLRFVSIPASGRSAGSLRATLSGLIAEMLHVRREDVAADESLTGLGLDASDAPLFLSRAAAAAGVPVPASPAWEQLTLDQLAALLEGGHPREDGARVELPALAYTSQVGREAMSARLAIVACDLDELRARLASYLDGAEDARVFHGEAGAAERGESPSADVEALLREHRLDDVARRWVSGAVVDWESLHVQPPPRRVSLPSYPFARERHWLKAIRASAPKDARTPSEGPARARVEVAGSEARIEAAIRKALAEHLGTEPSALPRDAHFAEYGVDSLGLRLLARELGASLGVDLPATLFLAEPTIGALTRSLSTQTAAALPSKAGARRRRRKARRSASAAPSVARTDHVLAALVRDVKLGALTVDEALEQFDAVRGRALDTIEARR